MLGCSVPEAALVKPGSSNMTHAPWSISARLRETCSLSVFTRISVKTEREQVSLSLAEMDQGAWVIFELPGFTKAASGTEQPSMDALRKANATSYFRGGDALWVKLVVTKPPLPIVRPTDLQASIAVSR